MVALGGIGEAAPLVGVVFAVLTAAGKRVDGTVKNRKAFESLNKSFRGTARVIQDVSHSQAAAGGAFPADVERSIQAFQDQLFKFARLLFEFRSRGRLSRLWSLGENESALTQITADADQARQDLLLASGLSVNAQVGVVDRNVRDIQVGLASLRLAFASPPPLPIREDGYAKALIRCFGRMLDIADAIDETEGSSYRQLTLDAVFVPQEVRACNRESLSSCELPQEALKLLEELGDLDGALKQRLADRRVLSELPAQSVLDLLTKEKERLVMIVGDARAGKSSALREVAIQWATATPQARSELAFPIVIELKQYATARVAPGIISLVQYIVNGGSVQYPIDEGVLLSRVRSHRVLIMLDGLDEVFPRETRNLVLNDIGALCAQFQAPTTRVVVTSRIVGYRVHELERLDFSHVVLQPFNQDRIDAFLAKWYVTTYTAEEATTRDQRKIRLLDAIRDTPSIGILARNPLLLTMIAIVNSSPSLPTRRVELYEKCAELLIARWKADEAVAFALPAGGPNMTVFDKNAKIALLRDLAFAMQQSAKSLGNIVQELSLQAVFEDHVKRRLERAEPAVARALIEQLRSRHGILCFPEARPTHSFTGRSSSTSALWLSRRDCWIAMSRTRSCRRGS